MRTSVGVVALSSLELDSDSDSDSDLELEESGISGDAIIVRVVQEDRWVQFGGARVSTGGRMGESASFLVAPSCRGVGANIGC